MIIAGIPYLNFLCIVLWCYVFIPSQASILPPKAANFKSIDSEILNLDFFACNLSIPYMTNVTRLMMTRYIKAICRRLRSSIFSMIRGRVRQILL